MILHCYYCALGGERVSDTSAVAKIEGLDWPFKAGMFKPLDPKHDGTPPFMTDNWQYMNHRACKRTPWPYDPDPRLGPKKLLTEKGLLSIENAIKLFKQSKITIEVQDPDEEVPAKCKIYTCHCGNEYNHASSLSRHKKECKVLDMCGK